MAKSLLAEAFEQLDLVDSGEFDFSKKGAEELAKFQDDDAFEDFETVIDPNAHSEEELQDSYIGMVILGCDVCNSMIYKAPEEVIIDEESQMANVGECCPYCFETDGFKVIGKVAPFEDISAEVTKNTEENEEKPEPTVKVNGKDIPVDEAPEKEEEAIESAQKYPVQSPIAEGLFNKTVGEKLKAALKKIRSKDKTIGRDLDTGKITKWNTSDKSVLDLINEFNALIDEATAEEIQALREAKVDEDLSNKEKLLRAFPELNFDRPVRESVENNLTEGMEDISITTDDQVIKVKATPRADKEEIEPITPAELEKAQEEAAPIDATSPESGEESVSEGDGEELVDLEEIDSESFDELGESYLKKVYDNVNSFKTISGTIDSNNLILEGVIEFNSGKKAKTKFIFEGKEITKRGKVRFVGLNENLSKNKRAFTLTGVIKNKNLVCESLNYNYLAKDQKVAKRLYGTIKNNK